MRLSELLGLEVQTESGESLGHVYDVRGELGARSLRVVGWSSGSAGCSSGSGSARPAGASGCGRTTR